MDIYVLYSVCITFVGEPEEWRLDIDKRMEARAIHRARLIVAREQRLWRRRNAGRAIHEAYGEVNDWWELGDH